MRLAVGSFIPKQFNYKNFWFKEKPFEKSLYKTLKVKKWKARMPSYNPSSYMTSDFDFSTIINTMYRNEVIHEINAVLSFVPILFLLIFGAIAVFAVASVFACLFDLIFVIMQ